MFVQNAGKSRVCFWRNLQIRTFRKSFRTCFFPQTIRTQQISTLIAVPIYLAESPVNYFLPGNIPVFRFETLVGRFIISISNFQCIRCLLVSTKTAPERRFPGRPSKTEDVEILLKTEIQ